MERIDLEGFLRQAAEPLEIPLELKGQSLLFDVEEENFLGDRTWTQEAVLNVLKNVHGSIIRRRDSSDLGKGKSALYGD